MATLAEIKQWQMVVVACMAVSPPGFHLQKNSKNSMNMVYLLQETLNIDSIEPLEILWMNIKVKFASIIRADYVC